MATMQDSRTRTAPQRHTERVATPEEHARYVKRVLELEELRRLMSEKPAGRR